MLNRYKYEVFTYYVEGDRFITSAKANLNQFEIGDGFIKMIRVNLNFQWNEIKVVEKNVTIIK